METFDFRGLTFTYPGQERPALDNITLTVRQGDFFLLCGPSGCGKSTLLRQCKTVLAPHGQRAGELFFEGKPLEDHGQRRQAQSIGFVQQSPDDQLVTDKVWHELAFGLESLGCSAPTIRRRVAEMASFFGIQNWFHRDVSSLSGGQKQLLNLAAVMTLDPSVLILDEPTSQLDPIAAADFLGALAKLNRELGTTVLLTEHRLEEALPLAGRVAVMDKGAILAVGTPQEVGQVLKAENHPMFLAMPTPLRVWAAVEDGGETPPITVREGRDWLGRYAAGHALRPLPDEPARAYPDETAVSCRDLCFKYEKDSPDVLNGLSLEVKRGEFLALLGGNGTGKSTLLKLLAGLEKPYRGSLQVHGALGVLPQAPQTLFVKKTVREDLLELCGDEPKAAYAASLCRLDGLLDRHPFDLSGGEQQRAALAKLLLLDPDVLLLDEPTKGLDGEFKEVFAQILDALLADGATVVMVSHDVEFCAAHAHRCALMFDGSIVTEGAPRPFFSGNRFYTTGANRMARDLLPQAVTAGDLISALGGVPHPPPGGFSPALPPKPPGCADRPPNLLRRPPDLPQNSSSLPQNAANFIPVSPKLPWWKKALSALFGCISLVFFLQLVGFLDLSSLFSLLGLTNRAHRQFWLYAAFSASLFLCVLCLKKQPVLRDFSINHGKKVRKHSRRAVLLTILCLLLVPLTLLAENIIFSGENYYFTMFFVLFECMIPFFLSFERRRPQARELVLLATLAALGVAGRTALLMLPQFKPTVALTIISGAAFGGETGFLVGSLTMLVSNVIFSQGAWTPWQMFATGMIGFLAGFLFEHGILRPNRLSFCVFGFLSTLLLYGGIMNFQSALQASPAAPTLGIYLSYVATGLPMDCIHAAATWFFLWVGAQPMLEKLERIKEKYGLIE